jgi:hypothetical protein
MLTMLSWKSVLGMKSSSTCTSHLPVLHPSKEYERPGRESLYFPEAEFFKLTELLIKLTEVPVLFGALTATMLNEFFSDD